MALLSDAELAENIAQYFVGGDLTSDLTEVKHTFTDILRDEIVGDTGLQALLYTTDGFESLVQGFIMTQVGHDHIFFADGRDGSRLHQQLL